MCTTSLSLDMEPSLLERSTLNHNNTKIFQSFTLLCNPFIYLLQNWKFTKQVLQALQAHFLLHTVRSQMQLQSYCSQCHTVMEPSKIEYVRTKTFLKYVIILELICPKFSLTIHMYRDRHLTFFFLLIS